MKKLIPLLVLLGGTVTGFSQGTVAFLNNVTFKTAADRLVYADTVGGTKLTGTPYVAELYVGSSAASLQPVTASIAKFRSSTTPQPGTWNFLAGTVALPGFNIGDTATLCVRVFDLTKFATYEAALAGGGVTGSSQTFTYTVPPAGSLPNEYYMDALRAFALVPEPSAIALGVLGIAGLLLIRRRK
jgi:hypothetical protein